MSRPLVSVIIPTYNRCSLLPRAIESVRAQTMPDWELIVVDDGSTDDTPALAEGYTAGIGSRWKYLRCDRGGSSAARNRGIAAAEGHFVAFLDSDDEFLPHKLERQLGLIERRPSIGFVYSDFSFVDFDGTLHRSALEEKFPIAATVPTQLVGPGLYACGAVFDTLLRGYFIATIVGLVSRDLLAEIRFDETLSYAEEWLFFLRVAKEGQCGFVDEPLSVHHYTPGSLARTDKAANVAGQHAVLRAIARQFRDLTLSQRAVLRSNLSRASRQMAYQALRERRRLVAGLHFASAWARELVMTTRESLPAQSTPGLAR